MQEKKISCYKGIGKPNAERLRECLVQIGVETTGRETIDELRGMFSSVDEEKRKSLFESTGKGEIIIRTDPFGLYTTLVGLRGPIKKEKAEIKECSPECGLNYESIPLVKFPEYAQIRYSKKDFNEESIILHDKGKGVFSAMSPDLYIVPLYVTFLASNHTKGEVDKNFTSDVLESFIRSGIYFTKKFRAEDYAGISNFMNFGHKDKSGASQPHLHAQRSPVYESMITLMDLESKAVEEKAKALGKDSIEDYIDSCRERNLVIAEDSSKIVLAPFAPRFDEQIDIYTTLKNREPIHCLDELEEREDDIKNIADGLTKSIKGLADLGIANFNILTHQERFGREGYYRLHWHICPRERYVGGMELNNIYIIGRKPEETAKDIKPFF